VKTDWLQFGRDPQHTGCNVDEESVTRDNVATLKQLFQIELPEIATGAPVRLTDVVTTNGVHSLVFLLTQSGDLVALDALTGAPIWTKHNPAGPCRVNKVAGLCTTSSSPVIDPNRKYVYAYGLDGYVHKYQVGTGDEVVENGWPEVVTVKPFHEKGSSSLAFAVAKSGVAYLYAASSGYPGDQGDYQGHMTTINMVDGTQRLFNVVCSNENVRFLEPPAHDCPDARGAIWGRAPGVYEPDTDRLLTATGNGPFAPSSHNWGDTVLALRADGTGANGDPLDTYTPTNFQQLEDTDWDLGSSVPAILPTDSESAVRHLGVQAGKDGILRLLDLDNLSGQGKIGQSGGELKQVLTPQHGAVPTTPAVWVNPADRSVWVFVATANGIAGFKLLFGADGVPDLKWLWAKAPGGSSPIVVNNILYYASDHDMRALAPTTGDQLWHDTSIGFIHWESPVLVDGVLYISDEGKNFTAYSLNGVPPQH
jgi:outer membrane protein assembly factor BamB